MYKPSRHVNFDPSPKNHLWMVLLACAIASAGCSLETPECKVGQEKCESDMLNSGIYYICGRNHTWGTGMACNSGCSGKRCKEQPDPVPCQENASSCYADNSPNISMSCVNEQWVPTICGSSGCDADMTCQPAERCIEGEESCLDVDVIGSSVHLSCKNETWVYDYCAKGAACDGKSCGRVAGKSKPACRNESQKCEPEALQTGWYEGICENHECTVRQCIEGYTLYKDDCVPSGKCCGKNCINCIDQGMVCSSSDALTGTCVSRCINDNEVVCNDVCINPLTSHEYCGVDSACSQGTSLACSDDLVCKDGTCSCADEGACFDGNACVSNMHLDIGCGAGCVDCTKLPYVTDASCEAGTCHVNSCAGDYVTNGRICCEAKPNTVLTDSSDPDRMITDTADADPAEESDDTPSDDGMSCAYRCADNYANCDGNLDNGCETDLSEMHLADCNYCAVNYEDCDRDKSNGCEFDLTTVETGRCGGCDYDSCFFDGICMDKLTTDEACGDDCLDCRTHGHAIDGTCVEGACHAMTCEGNYRLTGYVCCEERSDATLIEDDEDKFTCHYECLDDTLSDCAGRCVDYGTSVDHCGGCGHTCSIETMAHSVAVECDEGSCKATECEGGYTLLTSGKCVETNCTEGDIRCTNDPVKRGMIEKCIDNVWEFQEPCEYSCNTAENRCGDCINGSTNTCENGPDNIGIIDTCVDGVMTKIHCPDDKSCYHGGKCGECVSDIGVCRNEVYDEYDYEAYGKYRTCHNGKLSSESYCDTWDVCKDERECGECRSEQKQCKDGKLLQICTAGAWHTEMDCAALGEAYTGDCYSNSCECASGYRSNGKICCPNPTVASSSLVNDKSDTCHYSCSLGYHFSTTGTACERDTNNDCGDDHVDCTTLGSSYRGTCSYMRDPESYAYYSYCLCSSGYTANGKICCNNINYATVTVDKSDTCSYTCSSGYHMNAEGTACERDTDTSCGVELTDCTSIGAGNTCRNGSCEYCKSGYQSNGKICCQYLSYASLASDSGDTCNYTCSRGYHMREDGTACERDTNMICGEYHLDCSKLGEAYSGSCYYDGSCQCKSGYQSNGKICCARKTFPYVSLNNDKADTCNYSCNTGYHFNVDKTACERDTVKTCGSEYVECLYGPENGYPVCQNGKCTFGCESGYESNDHMCCPSMRNASVIFDNASECHYSCYSGYHFNSSKTACTDDTLDECGESHSSCTSAPEHATPYCDGGSCSYKCDTNYSDNGRICCANVANGKITRNSSSTCSFICNSGYHKSTDGTKCDPDSTGDCGESHAKCESRPGTSVSCSGGKCVYTCASGYTDNGKICCANVPNGSITKNNSDTCSFTCSSNYHKNAAGTGCEVNTADDCGASHTKCESRPGSTVTCTSSGTCSYSCASGYTSNGKICCLNVSNGKISKTNNDTCSFTCNSNYHKNAAGTGCEINSTSDCGSSHAVCNVEHATNSCTYYGSCSFSCNSGYVKDGSKCVVCKDGATRCDGNIIQTCHSETWGNTKTCSASDVPYATSVTCSGGYCIATECQQGIQNCGGECVDIWSNRYHCGGCNNYCTGGTSCLQGVCQ